MAGWAARRRTRSHTGCRVRTVCVPHRKAGPRLGKPFPLTPLKAWHVLQGWEVAPGGDTFERMDALPGKAEAGAGWVRLRQA